MRSACFVPIKTNSERVPGKNFRILNDKKLYEYLFEHIQQADVFDDIYVDTNSAEVKEYSLRLSFKVIDRKPELALNTANGNDLLVHHYELCPDYDYYFQMFVTAPYLQPSSIKSCYENLVYREDYDSCFTATQNNGFYWMQGNPVNYRPEILPRSQDMIPMIEESTGMYGICKESLERYRCRVGRKPFIKVISKFEAVDINTEEDLKIAEYIGKQYWHY
ncbi:cytidylyltransferase domain-containing protein [Butyrivibrio fibrisolvens]|uniref:acylneuraminate cytidylyltransferase family protein n=1 Tax=Butyrivibrio fibrisolvens TaxID=831 RepID=UPI0003B70A36|nr:acylneuraminate cytidylyltransferase [Butyrivibrio fibrisolvens]